MKIKLGRAISGNGNPAILLWYLEIPLYVLLLFGIFYIVKKGKYFADRTILYPIFFLTLLMVNIYLQYVHASTILKSINHLIDEYGAINQYTNTIYLNLYTFLIGICALLAIQSFVQKIKAKK